jgi:hypothetical protein
LREETNSGHASFKKSPKRIDWKTTTSQNPHFVRLNNEQAINTLQNTTEDISCGLVLSPAQQIQQKPRTTFNSVRNGVGTTEVCRTIILNAEPLEG